MQSSFFKDYATVMQNSFLRIMRQLCRTVFFSNTLMKLVSLYACCNLESKTRLRLKQLLSTPVTALAKLRTSAYRLRKKAVLLTVHIILWQN